MSNYLFNHLSILFLCFSALSAADAPYGNANDNIGMCEQDVDLAEILLRYGEEPDTVIFRAAAAGDYVAVRALIDFGVDCSKQFKSENLTDWACRSSDLNLIRYLVEYQSVLPSSSYVFETLMTRRQPFFDAVDYFLSLGLSFPGSIAFRVFEYDMWSGRCVLTSIDHLQFLFDRGASTECITTCSFLDNAFRYAHGLTVVGKNGPWYKRNGVLENENTMLLFLLRHGMDLNKQISYMRSDFCALHPSLKTSLKNTFGWYNTPLLWAISNENLNLAKTLIDCGADANFVGCEVISEGRDGLLFREPRAISPLALAMRTRNRELVALLIQQGAKI